MNAMLVWIIDLFFPDTCVICRGGEKLCCDTCIGRIKALPIQQCPECFQSKPDASFCDFCKRNVVSPLDFLVVGTSYKSSPIVARLIKNMKYKSMSRTVTYLPSSLWEPLEKLLASMQKRCLCLVPVPLHSQRLKERGFNQAEVLAKHIGSVLGIRVATDLLKRNRYTEPQAGKDREGRLHNLEGAFEIYGEVDPAILYILVDDVSSTRSTLEEAAKPLREAGVATVGGYVIARH